MKIYNEVVTIFNEASGLWETISEDSYEYGGPVAMAQGLPPNTTAVSSEDTIADTLKITTGYFTNGDGTLDGQAIHTGSLTDSNEKYYYNVVQTHPASASAEVQFSVTFADSRGSGSNQYGDSINNPSQIYGETQVIYKQLANLLLEENEASGGFKISATAGASGLKGAGNKDEYIYALIGRRERFKDRMNKKTWTLVLSGSAAASDDGGRKIYLTDDSAVVAGTASPGGTRYNIVSGALGAVHTPAADRTYGWFYPEMGIMVFSGVEIGNPAAGLGIPGLTGGQSMTASFDEELTNNSFISCSGFVPNENAHRDSNNALRLVNCMKRVGTNTLRLRSEEDQTQENYFCRIRAGSYNFSSNPTFVSGSYNNIRHITMHGNPQTFITGVGLYNSAGQLLATARLSSPLKKNFASEATIKVKLTY